MEIVTNRMKLYKKHKQMKKLLFLLLILLSAKSFSQIGGNMIYQNNSYNNYNSNNNYVKLESIKSTDSTFTINVNILLNKEADKYQLTLGTSQIGKTPKEAIVNINNQIDKFLAGLNKLNINKNDIYIDFVSQTKVYDFEEDRSNKIRNQIETGFEVKKNVIINLNKIEDIESIIFLASDNGIYNVVKVDYLNNNTEDIYTTLLNEAFSIEKRKKKEYTQYSNNKIIGTPRINDSFSSLFPKNLYKEYTAYESSDYERYSSSEKKILRKDKTFYYEGANYSGFDKVINSSSPKIGIQYILNLSVTYTIEKNGTK